MGALWFTSAKKKFWMYDGSRAVAPPAPFRAESHWTDQHSSGTSAASSLRVLLVALAAVALFLALSACEELRTTTTTTEKTTDLVSVQTQTRGWIESLVPAVGIVLTLMAASVAIWWNNKQNRWRRREYIVNAFQQRWDSPGAKNASFLLYWPDRHIPLWADDEEYRWERIDDREAAEAILPYVVHPFDFSQVGDAASWKIAKRRIALNDSFVDLIWRLDHVRVLSRAANRDDVREVIHEMGQIISGDPNADRLAVPGRLLPAAFRLMIAWRCMNDLIRFFDQYGYDIRPTDEDYNMLVAAFPGRAWGSLTFAQVEAKLPAKVKARRSIWEPATSG